MQAGRAASSDPHTPPQHSTPRAQPSASRLHHRPPASLRSDQHARAQFHAPSRPPAFTFEFAPELLTSSNSPLGRSAANRSSPENRKRRRSVDHDETEDLKHSDDIASFSYTPSTSSRRASHATEKSNSRGGTPAVRPPPQARSMRSRGDAGSENHAMEQ